MILMLNWTVESKWKITWWLQVNVFLTSAVACVSGDDRLSLIDTLHSHTSDLVFWMPHENFLFNRSISGKFLYIFKYKARFYFPKKWFDILICLNFLCILSPTSCRFYLLKYTHALFELLQILPCIVLL